MNLTLKRTPGIYLVGFMACGKTTIGTLLAERLGWKFVDMDQDIEARQGDPGYAATAVMLGESALSLALDGDRLPGVGWELDRRSGRSCPRDLG